MTSYTFSAIQLFSAVLSIISIFLVLSIFRKVYQEDYKKPWLFLGIGALFLAIYQIFSFMIDYYNFRIKNFAVTVFISYILEFIGMAFLTYSLFLEYMILKYVKGKFIKFKFIPVQEGSFEGKLDIQIDFGNSYLAYMKNKEFLINEFAKATKVGFEGFLIISQSPRTIRFRYKIQKTPILWIIEDENNYDAKFIKGELDQNSGILDPIHINDLIGYIDNFLETASSPFILIDIDSFFKVNSFSIIFEFLNYLSNKIKSRNGILIVMCNKQLDIENLNDLKDILYELN